MIPNNSSTYADKELTLKLRIVIDGRAYDVEVEDGEALEISDHSSVAAIQSSVLPTAGKFAVSSDFDETKVCRSPLAGVVSRVQVSPGQTVQQNHVLLILDAMKMEIKITAQSPGTIKSINVASGEAVKPDQILLCFE
jgi:methylmalonyl-CoA carboxyltransferase small subunit